MFVAQYKEYEVRKRRFTLMPMITLATLALVVAMPVLSSTRLYAAGARHFAVVTVRPGDTLWGIAAARTAGSANVGDTRKSTPALRSRAFHPLSVCETSTFSPAEGLLPESVPVSHSYPTPTPNHGSTGPRGAP